MERSGGAGSIPPNSGANKSDDTQQTEQTGSHEGKTVTAGEDGVSLNQSLDSQPKTDGSDIGDRDIDIPSENSTQASPAEQKKAKTWYITKGRRYIKKRGARALKSLGVMFSVGKDSELNKALSVNPKKMSLDDTKKVLEHAHKITEVVYNREIQIIAEKKVAEGEANDLEDALTDVADSKVALSVFSMNLINQATLEAGRAPMLAFQQEMTEAATPQTDEAPELQSTATQTDSPEEDLIPGSWKVSGSTQLIDPTGLPVNDDALSAVVLDSPSIASTVPETKVTEQELEQATTALGLVVADDALATGECSTNLEQLITDLKKTQPTEDEQQAFEKKSFIVILLGSLLCKIQKIYNGFTTLKMKFAVKMATDKTKVDLFSYLQKFNDETIAKAEGFETNLAELMKECNKMMDEYPSMPEDNAENAQAKAQHSAEIIYKLADLAELADQERTELEEKVGALNKAEEKLDKDKLKQVNDFAKYTLNVLSTTKSSIGFHSQVISRTLKCVEKPVAELAADVENEGGAPEIPASEMNDNSCINAVLNASTKTA